MLEVGIGLILMALQNDIFTSEAIHTKKFCVMPNIVSDHAPSYIQFEITDSESPIPHYHCLLHSAIMDPKIN
jgi:hypothetical protein